MSEVMLFGVLRMPYEMAMRDELSRLQYYGRGQEAADIIEALQAKTACTMGVGDGPGNLFVHGDHASIKAAQKLILSSEEARADATAALRLVSRIRFALGDNGARMQDELIEWCKSLSADAECFRFWVREASCNPVGIAKLIMHCDTEQDYRDAILPCITKAGSAIDAAKEASNVG